MVGRVDIPTYFDQECTRFYKNIRIAVLDKAAWDLADIDSVVIDGNVVRSPKLERIGASGTKTAIQVPLIAVNSVSIDTFNRERNWQMQRLSALFNSNISLNQSVNDSYNMAFFPGFLDATYYLKNGSKIISHYTEEFSYQGNSLGRDFVYMELVNPSGVTVATLGMTGGTDPMQNSYCRTPTAYGYTHQMNMLGSEGMLKESVIAYPGQGNTSACTYTCFYIFDDFIFHSDYYDCTTISARGTSDRSWYTSADFEKWIPLRNQLGAYSEGILYRFLGLNSSNNDVDSVVQSTGGKYVEDAEDDENTYPGGGNDKNPYPEDGESGKGTFDNTNDPIDFPTLPTWDATSTGFISMWNPTMGEILDLYSFLWDSDFGTSVKKLFNEPMDAIISLAYFPVDPIVSGKRNVTIGHVDSEIQMNHIAKQFCEFDFGSSRLDEYYGAAWDYSPYTRCSIYLPYIGVQPLNIDDVMNSDLHLKYHIDLLTGSCVAMLKSTRTRDGLDGVTYTWTGNCGMQVPITSGSAKEFITSMIQASAIAGLAMVNPCAGALTAGYAASHETSPEVQSTGGGQWVNPTMGAFAALNVIGQKVDIQRGSKVEANAGVISPQCAYLIIERPVSAIPKGWNEYAGYPSLKIKALSTQKGLTQVAYIKLNDLEATAAEISELDSILKGGVYL